MRCFKYTKKERKQNSTQILRLTGTTGPLVSIMYWYIERGHILLLLDTVEAHKISCHHSH